MTARTPGIVVRRGVMAASLIEGRGAVEGVPHVTGVLSGSGELFDADPVVDAMGRRSPLARMLSAIGARRPVEEKDDLGCVYYCRHFRIGGEERVPLVLSLIDLDSMTLLLIPADETLSAWSSAALPTTVSCVRCGTSRPGSRSSRCSRTSHRRVRQRNRSRPSR